MCQAEHFREKKKISFFTITLSGGCCCFVVVIVILILERRQRPREVRNIAQGNKDTKNNQGWDANGLTPGPSLLTTVLHCGSSLRPCASGPTTTVTLPYGNNSPGSQFWNQNPFSLLPYSCGVKKIICTVLWRKALKKCSESPVQRRGCASPWPSPVQEAPPVTFLSKVAVLLCEKYTTNAESLPALARFSYIDKNSLSEKWWPGSETFLGGGHGEGVWPQCVALNSCLEPLVLGNFVHFILLILATGTPRPWRK